MNSLLQSAAALDRNLPTMHGCARHACRLRRLAKAKKMLCSLKVMTNPSASCLSELQVHNVMVVQQMTGSAHQLGFQVA